MRLRKKLFAFASLVACVAACGGTAVLEREEGAGGAGGSGATTVSATSSTAVTSATTATTAVGTGGGPSCTQTFDGLQLEMSTHDGQLFGCNLGLGAYEADAVVVESSDGALVIDTCAPNADCAPQLTKLAVSAPGLFPYIYVNAFVHVRVLVEQPMGCVQRILITNLATWGGIENPFSKDPLVWLAAADGTTETFPEAPYRIDPIALACPMAPGSPTNYLLRISGVGSALGPADVLMGETIFYEHQPPGAYEAWVVRNLRSYESGIPDDAWNWSYWISQAVLGE